MNTIPRSACRRHARLCVALLLLTSLLPFLSQSAAPTAPSPQSVRAAAAYGHLPLAFEENQGQTAATTRFLAHGAGFTLALTADALLLAPSSQQRADRATTAATASAPVRFGFVGANPTPPISSSDPLPGIVNYFLGNDPAQWRTNIPTVGQVRYHDLYPGIDLTVYGRQGGEWEYDVVVAPGADPGVFGVAISGAASLRLADGDLVIGRGEGEIRQRAPALYQEGNGERHTIAGGYAMQADGTVRFRVGAYDRSLPLVIDPVSEVYGTYLGGSALDYGYGIAVDSTGNAYVTGYTTSTNFPTLNPIYASNGGGLDAFVTKINAAGSALVYSTYLGGSGDEQGNGIAVDSGGNAYLTGSTNSTNFPTQNPIQPSLGGITDAFVTKINAAGSALVYSTYLGGSGIDNGNGIAVDTAGNAYLTGYTHSTNFPTMNPIQPSNGGGNDAFVTKIGTGPAPPPTPTGLHVTGATTTAVYFGWTNPDPTANITVSDGATATPLAPGTTAFVRTGVPLGSYVCLSIAAWNSNGASAWSSWVCGLVVPVMPTGLHVSGATNTGVSFAWTDPDASSAIALGVGTTGGTTYTGLVPGTTTSTKAVAAGYWACAQVAAYNPSYASAFTPWVCGLAVPNAPTAIHMTGHTPTSVSFAWTDGDPYAGIVVSNGVSTSNQPAGTTAYTQGGMTTGSYVCISLAAYNTSGASPWSAAVTGWVCGQAT